MRFKSLTDLKRKEPQELVLAALPQTIRITPFALDKAFKISALVRRLFQESFEWYGFTLATREQPAIVIDIGLPQNDENIQEYVSLNAEQIALFQETLPPELIINGWIHSHGSLDFKKFSAIDEMNQRTVLDYVTTKLRQPVAKREIFISDLVCLVKGEYREEDLQRGSVNLITDTAVAEAMLLETVYGGFCFAIVIGDEGWHRQEIHHLYRGILSGYTAGASREAELTFIGEHTTLSAADLQLLSEEVQNKIRPITYKPEKLERV
jgi:hypothetical protein